MQKRSLVAQHNILREEAMRKEAKTMRRIIALVLCILLIPCAALAELTVYFLDVGQGDCAIIECGGDAMIIDGGLPGQSSKVYSFIRNDLHYNQFLYPI